MFCGINCSISIVFLVGMFYFHFMSDKNNITSSFINLLNEKQKSIYKNIIEERRDISLRGYTYGFLIALVLILVNYFYKKKKLSNLSIMCIVASITFLTQYFYYILSNKSNWMILNLNTQQQREEWLKVYRTFQFNYHFGIVLGIFAVMFLSNSFKCS